MNPQEILHARSVDVLIEGDVAVLSFLTAIDDRPNVAISMRVRAGAELSIKLFVNIWLFLSILICGTNCWPICDLHRRAGRKKRGRSPVPWRARRRSRLGQPSPSWPSRRRLGPPDRDPVAEKHPVRPVGVLPNAVLRLLGQLLFAGLALHLRVHNLKRITHSHSRIQISECYETNGAIVLALGLSERARKLQYQ